MTRNPQRIAPVLETVEVVWRLLPDLRLGQLLEVIGVGFFTEDVDLVQMIEANLSDLLPKAPYGPDERQLSEIGARIAELLQRVDREYWM